MKNQKIPLLKSNKFGIFNFVAKVFNLFSSLNSSKYEWANAYIGFILSIGEYTNILDKKSII